MSFMSFSRGSRGTDEERVSICSRRCVVLVSLFFILSKWSTAFLRLRQKQNFKKCVSRP